jgi:hypothetical protein
MLILGFMQNPPLMHNIGFTGRGDLLAIRWKLLYMPGMGVN